MANNNEDKQIIPGNDDAIDNSQSPGDNEDQAGSNKTNFVTIIHQFSI